MRVQSSQSEFITLLNKFYVKKIEKGYIGVNIECLINIY